MICSAKKYREMGGIFYALAFHGIWPPWLVETPVTQGAVVSATCPRA
ncbi:hypothetical protein [Thiolapillus sp.]